MFCRKCGKEILDDSKFCQYCGTSVMEVFHESIDKVLTITSQQAKSGIEVKIDLKNAEKSINFVLPSNINDGDLFRLKRVKFINNDGTKQKKDVLVKVKIID